MTPQMLKTVGARRMPSSGAPGPGLRHSRIAERVNGKAFVAKESPADRPAPATRVLHFGTILSALALTLVIASPAIAQPPDPLAAARSLEQALVEAIEQAEGAVVAISRVDPSRPEFAGNVLDPFGAVRDRERRDPEGTRFIPDQFGSGVIVAGLDPADDSRYVLTTYDVAYGGPAERGVPRPEQWRIYLRLASRDVVRVDAQAVAADRRSDLVVMKLDLRKADLNPGSVPVMRLGDAEHLRKGQFAIALGNPYAQARDGSASASLGIISNMARRPMPPADDRGIASDDATIHHYGTLLHVDTRLDLGTSGGALLNLDGELIGITTALAALEGYEKSVGYAIPLDRGMRRIIDDLIRGYEAEYGFLGIQPGTVSRNDARLGGDKLPQASAAVATQVAVDSPAYQAGLRNGDVILAIDGRPIYDDADLMRVIGLRGPDATVDLRIRRANGVENPTLTVRLGKWPVYDDSHIVSTARRYAPWRGMEVDYPTSRRRFLSSDLLEAYRRAVVATAVAADSPAAQAGLEVGEFVQKVNGVPVQTPGEFHAAVAEADGPVTFTLWDGRRRVVPP